MRHRTDVDTSKRLLWGAIPLSIVSGPINADESGEFIRFDVVQDRD